MNTGEMRWPNPDYVNAPYRVSFAVLIRPAPRGWSRKRRLRHRRLQIRQALGLAKRRIMGILEEQKQAMQRCELAMGTLTHSPNRKAKAAFFNRCDFQ